MLCHSLLPNIQQEYTAIEIKGIILSYQFQKNKVKCDKKTRERMYGIENGTKYLIRFESFVRAYEKRKVS